MEYQTYVNFEDDGLKASGIRIKQNDKNIKLVFHVMKEGLPYYSEDELGIVFKRMDGICVPGTATKEGKTYTYQLKGNETTVAGMLYCDLKLTDSNGRISTQTVSIYVVEDTQTEKIISGSYTVDNVNEIIDNLEHAAEKYDIDKIASEVPKINSNLLDLKMLGWSVPKELAIQNSVSGNVFTQNVQRVDMGTLSWSYNSTKKIFATNIPNPKKPTSTSDMPNIYNANYTIMLPSGADDVRRDWSYTMSTSGTVYVRDTNYSSATAFKSAMEGKYLYYQLDIPTIINIDGNEAVVKLNSDLTDTKKDLTNAKTELSNSIKRVSAGSLGGSGSTKEIPVENGTYLIFINQGGSWNINEVYCYCKNNSAGSVIKLGGLNTKITVTASSDRNPLITNPEAPKIYYNIISIGPNISS